MGRTGLLDALRTMLCQEWIPALLNVDAVLRAGGSDADVGCVDGQALLAIARGRSNARLVGFDRDPPAVAAAGAHAVAVDDRVRKPKYRLHHSSGSAPPRH
jgi:ribosomal protein L11 methylase PrmA